MLLALSVQLCYVIGRLVYGSVHCKTVYLRYDTVTLIELCFESLVYVSY